MSIAAFQTWLRDQGHDPGPSDGIRGKNTTEAAFAYAWDRFQAGRADPKPDTPDAETALLIAELERDEGRVLHAYTDSLGYLTIGIGRLIDKRKGGGISNAEADMLKRNDIARFRRELDARMPWWRKLDPVRQRAVQNMAFQMGVGALAGTNTFATIEAGDYKRAAALLRQWKWAQQTPARAARVIKMIETGKA